MAHVTDHRRIGTQLTHGDGRDTAGERLAEPVLRYLRSGLDAGMYLPDPSDPALETIRVVAEEEE